MRISRYFIYSFVTICLFSSCKKNYPTSSAVDGTDTQEYLDTQTYNYYFNPLYNTSPKSCLYPVGNEYNFLLVNNGVLNQAISAGNQRIGNAITVTCCSAWINFNGIVLTNKEEVLTKISELKKAMTPRTKFFDEELTLRQMQFLERYATLSDLPLDQSTEDLFKQAKICSQTEPFTTEVTGGFLLEASNKVTSPSGLEICHLGSSDDGRTCDEYVQHLQHRREVEARVTNVTRGTSWPLDIRRQAEGVWVLVERTGTGSDSWASGYLAVGTNAEVVELSRQIGQAVSNSIPLTEVRNVSIHWGFNKGKLLFENTSHSIDEPR